MIDRVVEWHRIVDVSPMPETIDRRKATAEALIKMLNESEDWDELVGMTAGVVAGFDKGHDPDAHHVVRIVEALRAEDSTVPKDLSENALEIRAIAAVALGELLSLSRGKAADKRAVVTAMLLLSGTGLRSRPRGKHLAKVIDHLTELAQETIAGRHDARRRRVAAERYKKIPSFSSEQTDAVANVKSLATAVRSALNEMRQQAAIDREELDILWWLYGAASVTTGDSLSDLRPGQAALICGAEVAEICLLPPLVNTDAFIREAMARLKRASTKRSLQSIMDETSESAWPLLTGSVAAGFVNEYPSLFPLSWLSGRLGESKGAAGWEDEFGAKTGIDASLSLQPVDLALQVFRERVAQRQLEADE